MVMHRTVNPTPLGTPGSIPGYSTKQYGIRQAVKSSPFQGEVTGSNPVYHTKTIPGEQSR
jgi:hypothetical protein